MKLRLVILLAVVALVASLFPFHTAVASGSDCYTVRKGDTLSGIADKYGVSMSAIMRANGIENPNKIYIGQCLVIPKSSTTKPTSGTCTTVYVVKRGDNLKKIAARYKVTVASIVETNHIHNPNLIYPGQRLTIKYKCSGKATTTKTTTTTSAGTWTWKGQYWNNRLLSGNPKYVRNSRAVNFNWGSGGPGGGVGPDNFSVRWTTDLPFSKTGKYRLHAKVDDGVRVFVDGDLVIDQWHESAVKEYTVDRQLSAGKHKIQIDYFEQTGLARILFWTEMVDDDKPSSTWLAEYFTNRNLEGSPRISRPESKIDYNWGDGAPFEKFPSDNFSARWTRTVNFEAGTYRFTVTADDGVQVLIDGGLIIDQWHDSDGATHSKDVKMTKGSHRIRVKYYEAGGKAKVKFSWAKVSSDGGKGPWLGKYYNNMKLQGGPVVKRTDQAINFNWGNKSPASGVTADYFSVEWTANIFFKEGTYRFTATMDDGMRVYVDDMRIIDQWHEGAVRSTWVDLALSEGNHSIKVLYFEKAGTAVAKLTYARK